ncbi:MAG: hypothetical protein WDO17_05305 [Alphaproteobacteria bacterium]
MLRFVVAAILAAATTPALAQDPCKAKWPLDNEHELLKARSAVKTASGAGQSALPATALDLKLEPAASARMVMPPERAPKAPNSYSGFVRFAGSPRNQTVLVTLSEEAWIDVVQSGRYVKSAAFNSLYECPTMRKSVKFQLAPGPFAVQLSGVTAETIKMTVTPAGE